MDGTQDINSLVKQHKMLRQSMPRAWNAFFAGFGSLRPVQLSAISPILSGLNTLVAAPTAGGKTEAVMAPVCERLTSEHWDRLSVLLITPTRALVNDLYQRLWVPCDAMRIRIGRKTSDHALTENVTEQVLVTTPESTESLLSFRRETLAHVRVVVLDEIHLLDGGPRGDHLRLVLSRLEAYLSHVRGVSDVALQRIAMSATISRPLRVAEAYLGNKCHIVSVEGRRQIESRIVLATGSDGDRAEAVAVSAGTFSDVRKVLVFVNSRKQVDTSAGYFRTGQFRNTPVYGHHGSLSKHRREEVETRFKNDQHAICVSTMTLEVGIDIGDIDLVVCMDPPFSMSSFLQRIGRGCRRLKGVSRVLCIARDRASELMFESMVRQAVSGLPQMPLPPFRRSVLLQQVLAYLRQVDKHRRTKEQFVRVLASDSRPMVTSNTVEHVLSDMVQTGLLDEKHGVFQPAALGWEFIQSMRIYGNIQSTPLEVALIDVDSGKRVATVAGLRSTSGGVSVAGRSYHILDGRSSRELRVRGGGQHTDSPRYHARSLPYATDIGAALANRLQIDDGELAVLRVADKYIMMTWLGRLWNGILAAGVRRFGWDAKEGSFHICIGCDGEGELLDVIRKAANDLAVNNPLGSMPVDRMVDLGPYFPRLSPSVQKIDQEDWLDAEFLSTWIGRIDRLRKVEAESALGSDLLALAGFA